MPKTLKPERQWSRPNAWQKTWSKSNFQQKKNSFSFRDATLDNGCLASARRIATHPKEWDMKPQQTKRSQLSQLPLTPSQNPEAFVFIACVLRLTDNAANHVNAFFHSSRRSVMAGAGDRRARGRAGWCLACMSACSSPSAYSSLLTAARSGSRLD